MIKKLLLVFLTAFVLFSCEKEKNASTSSSASGAYHLTAKFNGTLIDFSASLAAEKYLDPSNGYTISVLGIGGTTNSSLPSFDFIIQSDSEIKAKTYNESSDGMLVSYSDKNFNTYDEDDQFTITISSITNTEVKGTFAGKMIKSGSMEVINVTDGSFKAKIY